MTVHLIRPAAGTRDMAHFLARTQAFLRDHGVDGLLPIFTRNRPKRAAELLDGGSLYWIFQRKIQARAPVLGVDEDVDPEGRRYTILLVSPKIVRTAPVPRKPFQGWRYLDPKDAPPDLPTGADGAEAPPELAAALKDLGLL